MQNDIDPHDGAHAHAYGDPQSSAQADTNLLATKRHELLPGNSKNLSKQVYCYRHIAASHI